MLKMWMGDMAVAVMARPIKVRMSWSRKWKLRSRVQEKEAVRTPSVEPQGPLDSIRYRGNLQPLDQDHLPALIPENHLTQDLQSPWPSNNMLHQLLDKKTKTLCSNLGDSHLAGHLGKDHVALPLSPTSRVNLTTLAQTLSGQLWQDIWVMPHRAFL